MYPLPPINVPAPVPSDFVMNIKDLDDMLTDEEIVDFIAVMLPYQHIVWN
jgi:hypothetical protein